MSTAETSIGDLLDDPASRAIVDKYLHTLVANPQFDMARGMTLKDIQIYSPDITDEVLAKIDGELALIRQ